MSEIIVQSQPGPVWIPSGTDKAKLLQTGCEVTALSLKAGAGAAHVSLYNAKDASGAVPTNLLWTLDASTQDSDNQSFPSALIFKNGLFAVCDQGADLNAEVCFAATQYHS